MSKNFIEAIESKDPTEVLQLIFDAKFKRGAESIEELLSQRNDLDESPLICAIKAKMIGITKTIIRLDKNPDYQVPSTGDTAIIYAAKLGLKDIVIALLNSGADFTIRNYNNQGVGQICALTAIEVETVYKYQQFIKEEYETESHFNSQNKESHLSGDIPEPKEAP